MIEPTSLRNVRIDHVGSLLRPQWLLDAHRRHLAGQLSADELREAEDRAIRELIAHEEAVGLPVVTDGEYRRTMFMESVTASFGGLSEVASGIRSEQVVPGTKFQAPEDSSPRVLEPIFLRRNLPLEEYRFASSVATRPVKVTIVAPDRMVRRYNPHPVYTTEADYVGGVVRTYREMIAGLVNAGCRYVQIDAPEYTAYVDPASMDRMRALGQDPERNLARAIEMDNAIIGDFPGVTFGLHICRGNRRSMYHREGGYDAIAERLFGSLNHHRFLLEYDSERAGSFEPLRYVPRGRVAVLGLVTTKFPQLERAEDLTRRVDEASRYLSLDQLALSPQCGFASSMEGNVLGESDQWRKLELICEVATEVWR